MFSAALGFQALLFFWAEAPWPSWPTPCNISSRQREGFHVHKNGWNSGKAAVCNWRHFCWGSPSLQMGMGQNRIGVPKPPSWEWPVIECNIFHVKNLTDVGCKATLILGWSPSSLNQHRPWESSWESSLATPTTGNVFVSWSAGKPFNAAIRTLWNGTCSLPRTWRRQSDMATAPRGWKIRYSSKPTKSTQSTSNWT